MGFFSFFNGIKDLAGRVWGGIKQLPGKIGDGVRYGISKAKALTDGISSIASKVTNIPILGDIVKGYASASPGISNAIGKFNDFRSRVSDLDSQINR